MIFAQRITISYTRHILFKDSAIVSRLSTSTSNAINNLQSAVEDYRMKNYSQELPSRCKKDIIRAANCDMNGYVTVDGLHSIVQNIDTKSKVSRNDIESIFIELGEGKNNMSSSTLMSIL